MYAEAWEEAEMMKVSLLFLYYLPEMLKYGK
jgi:hypothetical protein